jgi:rsbT co-antagonist protein RsbR
MGVAVVDSAVANHIIKITRATKLMGCEAIITGISSSIAQTMVSLGIDLGDMATRSTLIDGLEYAFEVLGYHISRNPGKN